MSDPQPGTCGLQSEAVVVILCSSISLYNALEILIIIFTSFTRWSGSYFWSLVLASFGIIPYVIGFLIYYFGLTYNWIGFILSSYGWTTMVTGQSVVLYSRLHLLTPQARLLKAVKWMIIVDAIIFHVPTTIMLFASNIGTDTQTFTAVYAVYEKVQMTGFCFQEFVISGIYLRDTIRLLKSLSTPSARRTMWQLFAINVIIIALDIFLLAIEYRDLRTLEQTTKSLIYSVKLKLEFQILNKLVELVKSNNQNIRDSLADTSDFRSVTRTRSDTLASHLATQRCEKVATDNVEKQQLSGMEAPTQWGGEYSGLSGSIGKQDEIVAAGLVTDSLQDKSSLDYEYAEITRQISRA